MKDQLLIATAARGQIRALVAVTTQLVSEAQRRHDTWPTASAALGRTLTAGALMGSMLKDKQRLTIRIIGDGPLGAMVVDADAQGTVRGYVQEPHTHLAPNAAGKLDVAGAVGEGNLYIVKDLGLREPYQGGTPLISGEIAEDFTYYFAKSEQTPSAVALGVLVEVDGSVEVAGGYILQLLPGADDEIAQMLEDQLKGLPSVTQLISSGLDAHGLLERVLSSFDHQVLEEREVRFQCNCSRERLEGVLISMGQEELAEMIEEQGGAELTCHFCRQVYNFDADELGKLSKMMGQERQ